MNKTTNTLPPIEILDLLHELEAAGIAIPNSVDRWWFIETNGNDVGWEPSVEIKS